MAVKAVVVLGLLISSAFLSGCVDSVDHYSRVVDACDYQGTLVQKQDGQFYNTPATLRPECREKMLSTLGEKVQPSLSKAPAAYLDLVVEALQVLVGYPVVIPAERKILGVAPGSYPAWFVFIGTEDGASPERVNRNLFNYVVNQFEKFEYKKSKDSTGAKYMATSYWSGIHPAVVFYSTYMESPLMERVATLLHEARHLDGGMHVKCKTGRAAGFSICDADLQASLGFEIAYLQGVLLGSYGKVSVEGFDYLTTPDLDTMAGNICYNLMSIHDSGVEDAIPAELYALISNPADCSKSQYRKNWLLEREGLEH